MTTILQCKLLYLAHQLKQKQRSSRVLLQKYEVNEVTAPSFYCFFIANKVNQRVKILL